MFAIKSFEQIKIYHIIFFIAPMCVQSAVLESSRQRFDMRSATVLVIFTSNLFSTMYNIEVGVSAFYPRVSNKTRSLLLLCIHNEALMHIE